ncbi:minor capsid protein, partial [Nosocomiicoccus massiliensis]|uniref:minor capsid protein n=1 Tax=Nosocomiicoccus massiliensis TaxID=1232430 RepID=UPI0016526888
KELGLGKSFLSINSAVARNTIYDKWVDGRNFSDRIWANKGKLVNQLQTTIRDGFIRGDNYNSLSDLLVKRLDVGFSDAKRLIWTESSFVMNQASAQPYIDAGHTEYRINAIIDNKTSKICRHMHDEVFKFEDRKVGINFPPFHPWCRTMIVGVKAPRTLDDIKDTSEEQHEVTDIPVNYRKFNNVDDIKRYWKEKKGYNEWKDNLSETDLKAIKEYTGTRYDLMNTLLREGPQSQLDRGIPQYSIDRYFKMIENTKEAISHYETEDDLKVFRGIRGSLPFTEELKPGDITIIDKAFMSTSLDEEVTKKFMDEEGILFEIDIPKGIKTGSYMEDVAYFDNEHEFLLQPNTKFKVKDIIIKGRKRRIKLEVFIDD